MANKFAAAGFFGGRRSKLHTSVTVLLAAALLAVVIFSAVSDSYGNKISQDEATDAIWTYVEKKYTDIVPKQKAEATYSPYTKRYWVKVEDVSNEDISFLVQYKFGEITDDYTHKVTALVNTLDRLAKEYGQYLLEIFSAEYDIDAAGVDIVLSPRIKRDMPENIAPGEPFSPELGIFTDSKIILTVTPTDSAEDAAEIIEQVYSASKKLKAQFGGYELFGSANSKFQYMSVSGITEEYITSGHLSEILHSAKQGETELVINSEDSETPSSEGDNSEETSSANSIDISGVTFDVYYSK